MSTHAEKKLYVKEYRLSELNAKDEYDYKKIVNGNDIFLNCEMKVENERAILAFDIENKEEFITLFKENRLMKLKALLDVGNFYKYWNQYTFSIHPENLYCDMYGKVFVLFRDVCEQHSELDASKHLEEYKALIGCVLSNRYSYDDYFQGGMTLLKKNKFLSQIAETASWSEVVGLLQEEAERVIVYNKEKRIDVNRSSYQFKKYMTVFSFIILVAFLLCCGYYLLWVRPYDKGVIQAQNAYLDLNYTQVIKSLEKIDINRLDNYQKYILATSYIKCENLTDEQKSNVLVAVKIQGDEKILDYWISIGRLDVTSAENIAQQLSDEQLLVYAYLKERYVVEADAEISGEEKTAKLQDLDEKIQTLTQQKSAEE